jgi:endonuclease YncB( thermonuclease family)
VCSAALLIAILALAPGLALADFDGRVVTVTDGDTLAGLGRNEAIAERLDSIDAPETRQPYYSRSRTSLIELCQASRRASRSAARIPTAGSSGVPHA